MKRKRILGKLMTSYEPGRSEITLDSKKENRRKFRPKNLKRRWLEKTGKFTKAKL